MYTYQNGTLLIVSAGDHVKFNLPMAFSAHVLAYGLNRWKDGYSSSNQLQNMYEMLRTPLDYFMKCWRPQSQEYYAQVWISVADSFPFKPFQRDVQITINRKCLIL